MTTPVVHDFPVKRVGFIQSAEFQGPDAQLQLRVTYPNQTGGVAQIIFSCRNVGDGSPGEICLPAPSALNNDLHNLGPRYEDMLRAHTRMSCLVAGTAVPGSVEFDEAIATGQTANLQTGMGAVKILAVTPLTDETVRLQYRLASGGPTVDVEMDYGDLNKYSFAPETQLYIIPGSVKKQFSTYVHDYPTTILSQTRREEIQAYIMAMAPWI